MKIAVATLGCKINQFDTAVFHELALDKSHDIVDYADIADVYVINTCTVTRRADSESRALIRKAKRQNPDARVIVTGCYAQTNPEAIEAMPDVDVILGNPSKFEFLNYIGRRGEGSLLNRVEPFSEATPLSQPIIRRYAGHSRAFLKVQEGCDDACTFCIVPASRGMSRSLPIAAVLQQVRVFSDQGYRELVLTGVQLGCYGGDLNPPADLPALLSDILDLDLPIRLRLSSIHPTDVSERLIGLLASSARLCRHIHTSMQSGDDAVLRRMARDYDAAAYRALIEKLAESVPDIGIGSDVLVGFPGETDQEFENTFKFIEGLPLTYLHVFTFSPRPFTPAGSYRDQIPGPVKKDRSSRLRHLAAAKSEAFIRRFIGDRLPVVIEKQRNPGTGRLTALTDNFLRVEMEGADDCLGGAGSALMTGLDGGSLIGELDAELNLPSSNARSSSSRRFATRP